MLYWSTTINSWLSDCACILHLPLNSLFLSAAKIKQSSNTKTASETLEQSYLTDKKDSFKEPFFFRLNELPFRLPLKTNFSRVTILVVLILVILCTKSKAQVPTTDLSENQAESNVVKHYVPSLIGKRIQIAQQYVRLSSLKFESGVFMVSPRNWRADIEPNVVYLQVPRSKELLSVGDTIATWRLERAEKVSTVVVMPDLRGQTLEKAIASAMKHKLSLTSDPTRKHLNQTGKSNQTVVDHYPRPGQKIYSGTSVFFRTGHNATPPAD